MDATTIKNLSIDDKLTLYHQLADDIIDYIQKEDGVFHHCFKVRFARLECLYANDYNPNRMPKEEMRLLKDCVEKYGFLFPVITVYSEEKKKWRIVDGFHRYEDFRKSKRKWISFLELKISYHDAIQLTVLMNRIKGMHQVEKMSDLVVKLKELGLSDDEIANNLGMEAEEYMRLKQQLGMPHAFKNVEYSNSWEIEKNQK